MNMHAHGPPRSLHEEAIILAATINAFVSLHGGLQTFIRAGLRWQAALIS